MVAFTFKPRFVIPIELGDKRQTIRGRRKRNARAGDTLQLFTGPRMRPRKIGEARCIGAGPISIDLDAQRITYTLEATADDAERTVNVTAPGGLDNFAQRDGFRDWDDMRTWWRETYPDVAVFDGWLTLWAGFRGGNAPIAGDDDAGDD